MSGMAQAIYDKGVGIGRTEGIGIGAKLMNFLWSNGRGEEAQRAANDETFLNQLIDEFMEKTAANLNKEKSV